MDQFSCTAVALIYFLTTWTTFNVNGDNAIVVARKGTRAILPCFDQKQLNDVSSLSWIKTSTNIVLYKIFEEDDPVFRNSDKYSVSYSYQLEILNVNTSDAGSYICEYRISASVTSRTIKLYVPELYIEECSVDVESTCRVDGSSDTLTCKFSGFPANITVSWQRILVEQRSVSSGELVTTYDREIEDTSFACRVSDDSGGNSRYAPFEQLQTVSGYANIPGNKTDWKEDNAVLFFYTTIVFGSLFVILFIINIIVCYRSVYRKKDKAPKEDRGYSKKDRKTDKEVQRMLPGIKWKPKTDVALSGSMKCMAVTPNGMMAVGCNKGEYGIEIYSADGKPHGTELKGVKVQGIGFLSDGRCAVLDTEKRTDTDTRAILNVSLYDKEWIPVKNIGFDFLGWDEGGSNDLTVDSDDHIYVWCTKNNNIQVFTPNGGEPVRHIPCDGYIPDHIVAMQCEKKMVVKCAKSAVVINELGVKQHELPEANGLSVYPAVCKDNTLLIATVNKEGDRVTIELYTSKLQHVATLIKNHKIQKSDQRCHFLQELKSEQIAFCTPDKLYIFSASV